MVQPVSSQVLLEGGWYALEQCGRLLDDAAHMFNSGRHGTAAGIALVGREELGKAWLLFKLSTEVAGGLQLTPAQVRERIEGHPQKQKASAFSVGVRAQEGSQLAELSRRASADTESAETEDAQAARREMDDAMERMRRSLPGKRQALREGAFYVDLDEAGARWSRPGALARDKAFSVVMEAHQDYAILRGLISVSPMRRYVDLRRRLEAWSERPELPDPALPSP